MLAAVDDTEAHLLALLEGLLPVIWIAAAVGLAVTAGRMRSRLPLAFGLTAVPPLGFLFTQVFC
jgi:hypothetical protein